jgi:hypothetical protein
MFYDLLKNLNTGMNNKDVEGSFESIQKILEVNNNSIIIKRSIEHSATKELIESEAST